jgi:hypothetical protein
MCPASTCGTTTLNLAEVALYATPSPATNIASGPGTVATADSEETDAASVTHSAPLAIDGDMSSWFGSASTGAGAWLEVDLGAAAAPYYDELLTLQVYNRWAAGPLPGGLGRRRSRGTLHPSRDPAARDAQPRAVAERAFP